MRRLLRRLLTLLALGSLVLCAASATLWVRSYRVRDRFEVSRVPQVQSWVDSSDPDLPPIPMARYHQLFADTFPGRLAVGDLSYDAPFALVASLPASSPPGSRLYSWTTGDVIRDIDTLDHHTSTRFGFGIDWGVHDGLMTAPKTVHAVRVPLWFPTLVFALLPLALARARYRSRRYQRSRCLACGYDLRATSDRCPECGTVPAATTDAPWRSPADRSG